MWLSVCFLLGHQLVSLEPTKNQVVAYAYNRAIREEDPQNLLDSSLIEFSIIQFSVRLS